MTASAKFVRLDEDHFAYLVSGEVEQERAIAMAESFRASWPGKRLIVMSADEFVDLTGQFEVLPIADKVAS